MQRSSKYPVTVVSEDFKVIKESFGVPVYSPCSNCPWSYGCEGILFKCYFGAVIFWVEIRKIADLYCDDP